MADYFWQIRTNKKYKPSETVDVVKLILVLTIVFCKIFFIYLLKITEIIRAFGVNAFMDDEVLAVLLWCEGMGAVRIS